jgi:hypothetical protein
MNIALIDSTSLLSLSVLHLDVCRRYGVKDPSLRAVPSHLASKHRYYEMPVFQAPLRISSCGCDYITIFFSATFPFLLHLLASSTDVVPG